MDLIFILRHLGLRAQSSSHLAIRKADCVPITLLQERRERRNILISFFVCHRREHRVSRNPPAS